MNQYQGSYAPYGYHTAADAPADARAGFIVKTYLHLAGAIFAFVILEAILLASPLKGIMLGMLSGGQMSWLIIMIGFIGVSWLAQSWANSSTSPGMQYAGLILYVVAQAVIFVPLMAIANVYDPAIIPTAGLTTLALFAVMTGIVFVTRIDFSFMRAILMFGSFAALALIVVAIVTGFSLGPIFMVCMIALACGYIIYDTSNVLHRYRIGQHVAAALALFASVALLLWYVIQLFMSRR